MTAIWQSYPIHITNLEFPSWKSHMILVIFPLATKICHLSEMNFMIWLKAKWSERDRNSSRAKQGQSGFFSTAVSLFGKVLRKITIPSNLWQLIDLTCKTLRHGIGGMENIWQMSGILQSYQKWILYSVIWYILELHISWEVHYQRHLWLDMIEEIQYSR